MRNAAIGFLGVLGFAASAWAQAENTAEPPEIVAAGQTEIRIMIFDRHWMPIDVKSASATLDVWPDGGSKRNYKLEMVSPPPSSGGAEGAKNEAPDRTKMQARRSGAVCGQVREMEPFHIEMVVCSQGSTAKADSMKSSGRLHHHGACYLKVVVPNADLENQKTGAIKFEAQLRLGMADKTEIVKGFVYPEGWVESSLDRFVDYDLKDIKEEAKLDPNRPERLSRKIQMTLDHLPPLSFKSDEDRSQYEKAVNECREASVRLGSAHGKDLETLADDCRVKCKEVISQAKDAQGALTAE